MRTTRQRMAADLKIAGYRKSKAHQSCFSVLRISLKKAEKSRLRDGFRGRLEGVC